MNVFKHKSLWVCHVVYHLPGRAYSRRPIRAGEQEAAESHMHYHIGKPWTCCVDLNTRRPRELPITGGKVEWVLSWNNCNEVQITYYNQVYHHAVLHWWMFPPSLTWTLCASHQAWPNTSNHSLLREGTQGNSLHTVPEWAGNRTRMCHQVRR